MECALAEKAKAVSTVEEVATWVDVTEGER